MAFSAGIAHPSIHAAAPAVLLIACRAASRFWSSRARSAGGSGAPTDWRRAAAAPARRNAERIQLRFDVQAPQATEEQVRALREKTEQYCVVMQTLLHPPRIETAWAPGK